MQKLLASLKKTPVVYIISIAAFCIVVIAATIFYFHSSDIPEDNSASQSGMTQAEKDLHKAEEQLLQVKLDKYALYNKAADAMDVSICEQIQESDSLKADCKDNVYVIQASKKSDQTFCEKVVNIGRKSHCLAAFSYDKAVASGKFTDCNSITGDDALKSACMKNVVFAQIENPAFSGSTDTCNSLS